jgi:hypothetical protein
MKAHDTTVRNELAVEIKATLNLRHPMNNVNKSQATVLAANKGSMETGYININRNQNGSGE